MPDPVPRTRSWATCRRTCGGCAGRGLWLAHQLCDVVEIAGDRAGTDVQLRLKVGRAA
jgi:hypothetical protein